MDESLNDQVRTLYTTPSGVVEYIQFLSYFVNEEVVLLHYNSLGVGHHFVRAFLVEV